MYVLELQVVLISGIETRSVQFVTWNFQKVVDFDHVLESSNFSVLFLHFFPGGVQVLSATVPSEEERKKWWQAFYRGVAYPTLARVLLHGNVIASYLYCLVLIS